MYKPEIDIKRTEDVEITRAACGVRANFPLVGGYSRDFEYGFAGAGPSELGLSALNAFVPACSDGEDAMDLGDAAKIRFVSQFAWQFRHQFANEVLGGLPQDNGTYTIKASDVRQWIEARLAEEIKRATNQENPERANDATLKRPAAPRGGFRQIIEKYPNASEETTGGGCMATHIPCDDGTHLLVTDLGGMAVPSADAEVVLVGRYNEDGPVDISRTVQKGEYGAVEVLTHDLERVIDEAFFLTQPARGQFRAVIEKYPQAKETTTGGDCTAIQVPCGDRTYLLLTDPRDGMSPEADAEFVCVSRHNDQGPVDITPDLRGGDDGTVEVPVSDLAHVLGRAMGHHREAAPDEEQDDGKDMGR